MKLKRIIGLGLVSLSILGLSSCILLDLEGSNINRDLSYTWTDKDYDKLKENMERFEEALDGGNEFTLVGSYASVTRAFYACATYRTIENINYAAGDDSAYDKYLYFQGIIEEVAKWQEALYPKMYESEYKDQFFSGYTEEEIQELLNSAKPDEYYEIENKQEALRKQYNDLSRSEKDDGVYDIYLSLVKNYKDEATLLGYDNYLQYAYKGIYEREYTPEEVETFNTYVKDYIVPMMFEVKESSSQAINELSSDEKQKLYEFQTTNFNQMKDTIKAYGTFVGDAFEKNLDYALNRGYIKYGGSNCNIDGAFTTYLYMDKLDQPIMYFGPSYLNTMTFIHEFGHYNNFFVNKKQGLSYDLAETHSQGDEMLFLAWLDRNDESYSDKVMEAIRLTEVYDALTTIVLATMVNQFEYSCYTSEEELTKESLDNLYKAAGDSLGGYDDIVSCVYGANEHIDYWKLVTVENAGYYISYAISKIPSLEIYSMARENLSLAKSVYKKTYTLDSNSKLDTSDFLKVLNYAGLYSPFDEEAFKLIEKLK